MFASVFINSFVGVEAVAADQNFLIETRDLSLRLPFEDFIDVDEVSIQVVNVQRLLVKHVLQAPFCSPVSFELEFVKQNRLFIHSMLVRHPF